MVGIELGKPYKKESVIMLTSNDYGTVEKKPDLSVESLLEKIFNTISNQAEVQYQIRYRDPAGEMQLTTKADVGSLRKLLSDKRGRIDYLRVEYYGLTMIYGKPN